MTPEEAEQAVRVVCDAAIALRRARLEGERLLLDEETRARLSGAVLILAWLSVEEAPLRPA